MNVRKMTRLTHPAKYHGKKIVLVVGSGFAGLAAAKLLSNQPQVQVALIDVRNYHLFQPLLYQVATAGLHDADIAVPIRSQFSHASNVDVHMGCIEFVNLKEKFVRSKDFELEYDYLVLACGAKHSYFGHNEWEQFAPGLKTVEQAVEIRRRVLMAFELAENELNSEKQKSYLTFVIVGGGPTGVEMAGAIADLARTVLVRDFKRIKTEKARIILVEGSSQVLGSFGASLAQQAKKDLESLGVEVLTSCHVTQIDEEGVNTDLGRIVSKCVLWAAGVKAAGIEFSEEIEKDKANRIKVAKDLSLPAYPNVFVVGDMAMIHDENGQTVPGLAPAAIQEGKHAAKNIIHRLRVQPTENFHYNDKGQMATIGRNKAIAKIGKFNISGYPAWLAWLFIHVFYLVGFKNQLGVLFDWAWNYIFAKRGSRLITSSKWQIES